MDTDLKSTPASPLSSLPLSSRGSGPGGRPGSCKPSRQAPVPTQFSLVGTQILKENSQLSYVSLGISGRKLQEAPKRGANSEQASFWRKLEGQT